MLIKNNIMKNSAFNFNVADRTNINMGGVVRHDSCEEHP